MIEGHWEHLTRGWPDGEVFHGRMRGDPFFALAVRTACQMGVPFSEFMGRVAKPGEPRWLQDDRDTAMAYTAWAAQLCQGCGLHPLDWPNELDETHKGHVYVCFGCQEMNDTRRTLPEKTRDRQDIHVTLVPRSEQERLLLDAVSEGRMEMDDLPAAFT